MWSDDENGIFGAFRSSKDDKNMFKIALIFSRSLTTLM